MKIRLLSDIHRESGPWTWTDQGEDVVVLAGDVDNGIAGVEWAKTIPKPVIMVAGNHEHWGEDLQENLSAMRKAARGSNVHFLERNSAIITVNGESMRFLGCTLWTNYCDGSDNMIHAARDRVRDYGLIKAGAWNKRNLKRIAAFKKRHGFGLRPDKEDELHPLMLMDIHKASVKWLERELNALYLDDIPTIVVTHHAPSMQSLVHARMIHEVQIGQHDGIRSKEDAAMRMAAYASDLDWLIKHHRSKIAVWMHGHTHEPLDYALHNVRIVCNPRGYHDKPLGTGADPLMALFGYSPSPEAVKRDQAEFDLHSERGTVQGFEPDKLIDIADGLVPSLVDRGRHEAERLVPLIAELQEIASNRHLNEIAPIALRATENILDHFNEVLDDIRKLRGEGGSKVVGPHFPGEFHASMLVDGNIREEMQKLIELAERVHAFFAGDQFEQHVRHMWSDWNKDWIRRKQ